MSKAENTKAYIVERTAPVFNKKGYAGTSLADLTEATGLTKGALYGNFKNKDEIALAAFDYNLELVKEIFFANSISFSHPVDQLLAIPALVKKNFPKIAAHGGCPVLNTSVEADDNHPSLKKKVAQTIKSSKKNIQSIIEKGIASGVIRKQADPSKYALIFLSVIEGSLMLTKITGDLAFLDVAMEKLKEIILTELKK
ncbi:MAG: TetR/AcrR family transcriptional regulator [Bacteroidota bacterium]|nr:TetR/AcrR family transcriptional regulator [Bacteroidota bacterium]